MTTPTERAPQADYEAREDKIYSLEEATIIHRQAEARRKMLEPRGYDFRLEDEWSDDQ